KERAAVNRARALRLRVSGQTCPAIAKQLGVSRVLGLRRREAMENFGPGAPVVLARLESLPVPLSPVVRTGSAVTATRPMVLNTWSMAGVRPTSSYSAGPFSSRYSSAARAARRRAGKQRADLPYPPSLPACAGRAGPGRLFWLTRSADLCY